MKKASSLWEFIGSKEFAQAHHLKQALTDPFGQSLALVLSF
jgi:hypothetical protein